jgi:multidrug efflux pump subunit AcrA (membrane-fusion protein)
METSPMHALRFTTGLLLAGGLLASIAIAQNTEPTTTQQLIELRQGLAQAKLDLQRTKAQMEELRAFLAEKDLDKKLEGWRAERARLVAEQRKLKLERQRLETARKALHQQTTKQARDRADEENQAKQAAADALKPGYSIQYMMGLIDKERENIYVESTDGKVLVEQYPSVDRKNVKVRGTFLNKSQAPWRYTFELRVAGERNLQGDRARVGQWRYQTPVLGAGELHAFEVTVPVSDIRHIEVIQIGNVVSDRPPKEPDAAPKPDA